MGDQTPYDVVQYYVERFEEHFGTEYYTIFSKTGVEMLILGFTAALSGGLEARVEEALLSKLHDYYEPDEEVSGV